MKSPVSPKASNYDLLSFDCYGTLLDWESAITTTLQAILLDHDVHWNDAVLLEHFAEWEPIEQTLGGSYRQVLNRLLNRFGTRLGFAPTKSDQHQFEECIARAMPFPDTIGALQTLGNAFQLAVISNTDDDLFSLTAAQLGIPFAHVITAEQVGSYKPSPRVFEYAVKQFACPKTKVLHIAQSLFHDIQPATSLGISTVWIDRTAGKPGATAPAITTPDWTYSSLAEFVQAINQN